MIPGLHSQGFGGRELAPGKGQALIVDPLAEEQSHHEDQHQIYQVAANVALFRWQQQVGQPQEHCPDPGGG